MRCASLGACPPMGPVAAITSMTATMYWKKGLEQFVCNFIIVPARIPAIEAMARVFLITPFSPETAGNENPETFSRVQKAVQDAAARTGVDLVHPKQMPAAGVIVEQIEEELQRADLVIGILTGDN